MSYLYSYDLKQLPSFKLLSISLTLPVSPIGLIESGLAILESAKAHGARIDIVNIMTMNYGPANLDMGQTAISASEGTLKQIESIGFPKNPRLGITPMAGVNDVQSEMFLPKYAQALLKLCFSPFGL